MMEYFTPIQLLCNRVGRQVFESMYSVMLPKPAEFEDPNRPATAHELLTAMAFMRGFMSAAGIPDCSRSARAVIKDVFNGKLKWMAAPPGFNQEEFDKLTFTKVGEKDLTNSGKALLTQVCFLFEAFLYFPIFSLRNVTIWLALNQKVYDWTAASLAMQTHQHIFNRLEELPQIRKVTSKSGINCAAYIEIWMPNFFLL